MNGLTVSELANKLNLERSYFTALFTRKLGLSPKEYLTDIRMKQAAMLLLQYDYNITVTALSVGYSDVYNFSKMFKKYYLMSPKEYIKKNKPLLP
jgi:AraC-like DNA-binding protein